MKQLHAIFTDQTDPFTGTVRFIAQCGEVVPSGRAVEVMNFRDLVNLWRDGDYGYEVSKSSLCPGCVEAQD